MLNNNHIFKNIASALYAVSIITLITVSFTDAIQPVKAVKALDINACNDTPPYGE